MVPGYGAFSRLLVGISPFPPASYSQEQKLRGADHFLGGYSHLMWNWLRLVAAAGLSTREYAEAMALLAAKIGFFRQTAA